MRVAAKNGENPFRRRGKGFLAMFVSQELADPKVVLNRNYRKGSRLIFLRQNRFCLVLTHWDSSSMLACIFKHRNPWRTVMVRSG